MNKHSNCFASVGTIAACTLLAALSGCNNTHDASDSAPHTTIGTQIDDSVISARARSALLSNDDIKSLDIKVTTNKGVVLLSGFADNQAQIDRAGTIVSGVEDVKSVDNKLTLKEGKQTIGNKIDDSVITASVKSAMIDDATMKSLDVSVTTRKGEVQLSGFVDNNTQLTHAADVAKGVDGVTSVMNNLSLKK